MAKVGSYIHRVEQTGLSVAYDNSYGTDKVQQVKLNVTTDSLQRGGSKWGGQFSLIRLKGVVSGGATSITLQGSEDAAGQFLMVEPTTATLVSAISGASKSAVFKVDAWFNQDVDSLYLFIKTNAGSFTLNEVMATWRE
jgi:hypothetical protein